MESVVGMSMPDDPQPNKKTALAFANSLQDEWFTDKIPEWEGKIRKRHNPSWTTHYLADYVCSALAPI